MLLSAASLVVSVWASDVNDLSPLEQQTWNKIRPAIVFLLDGGDKERRKGSAVLISKDGYFITHATALSGKSIEAVKSDNSTIKLMWVATDEPTQFVLLKAEGWTESTSPISVAEYAAMKQQSKGRERILAVTANGPISAERSTDNTYGIINPSKRFMTMNEVLLENNIPTLGGSLLFNLNGQFAGVLNAALGLTEAQNSQRLRGDSQQLSNNQSRGAQGTGGFSNTKAAPGTLQYGPGVLTAAYTVGPKVLRRVVSGFLSEDRTVRHPTIGIFCKTAMPQGALIDSVTKGSPAEKAGLIKGDIIFSMNNQAVRDQIDFARIMADQEIGDTLKVWVQGPAGNRLIAIEVGSQP